MSLRLLVVCMLFFYFNSITAQHNIIPTPVKYQATENNFIINKQTSINIQKKSPELMVYAEQLQDFLKQRSIIVTITQKNKIQQNAINLHIIKKNERTIGKEGYLLDVNKSTITISANDSAGIFNGIQTLEQLVPINSSTITGCTITDYPRFKWRGLMLDVSRHFFSVEDVKKYIDLMSQYKFNVFHWHLTDDNGWRIEIKSLPKLTEIGAWRVERHGKFGSSRKPPKPNEKATYGGFYTQEQIKDIVKYAQNRNITIVPEIDVPGHSMALLAAYPELSTKKEPKYVVPGSKFSEWYGGGKFKMLIENTVNPADENVYKTLDKIFTEVATLFPGEYIHMGGDEAYHGYWEADKGVQKLMKKHKLKDSHAVQSYFVKRVEKIINSKGKKMIGWDEILDGNLNKSAAVMSWRGMKGGIKAAKKGHKVVMSPTTYAYLDYTQGDLSVENKIYADLNLEKTYQFEPVPKDVDASLILGGQANLWTEAIPTIQYAFYMTYPRAFSIAETLWSPKEQKNWKNFIDRTEQHFTRFDSQNISISKAVLEPKVIVYKKDKKLFCKLENAANNIDIYYTIDNTNPVQFGTKYSKPFEIPEGNLKLRTQSFRNGKPIGRVLIINREDLKKRLKRKPFSFFD